MKSYLLFCFFLLGITQQAFSQSTSHTSFQDDTIETLLKKYETSLRFQENKGQWDNDAVLYKGNNEQASFQFTPKGVSIGVLGKESKTAETAGKGKIQKDTLAQLRDAFVWNLNFLGKNPNPNISGKHPNTGKINYVFGGNSNNISNTELYQEVWYESVYDNIDARFYSSQEEQLEYDFIVYPGAKVSDINLEMEGIKDLSITPDGAIVFKTPMGELKKGKPYTYQKINGQEIEIASRYVLESDNSIRFAVGNYDPKHELVIDPIVLAYSTYLGSTGGASSISIASMEVDSDGNIVVAGSTSYYELPVTPGSFQTTTGGRNFILKFDETLSTVIWGTYFRGSPYDFGTVDIADFALDAMNNVYIGGELSIPNLNPISSYATPGAWQETPLSTTGAYAAKLSADGTSLVYFTYITGNNNVTDGFYTAKITELDVDDAGNLVAVGLVDGNGFSTSPGVVQPSFGGEGDLFVVSLNNTGGLNFSTHLGGGGFDFGGNVEIAPGGNIYIAGVTYGFDYPTTAGVFGDVATSLGDDNLERGVISVLNPTGTAFVYSTYINDPNLVSSSSPSIAISDMKVDDAGSVYVTGESSDGGVDGFSFSTGSFSQVQDNGFLVKMDASGQRVFSTALADNSSNELEGINIALDDKNNVYILGRANSGSYAADANSLNEFSPHTKDHLLLMFSADGSEKYFSTNIITNGKFGSSNSDRLVIQDKKLYIAGVTGSVHTNVTPGAYQTVYPTTGRTTRFNTFISIFDIEVKPEEPNTISPASQNVCTNGRTEVIEGTDLVFKSNDYIQDGVIYEQIIEVPCQWQASNDGTVWEDIPGAISKDFLPAPSTTSVSYRRVCGTSPCDRDTSNVHSLIVGTDLAPEIESGTVSTCLGTPVQFGALATGGTGGTYSYSWLPTTGLDNPNIAQPSATITAGGAYNVVVTDNGNGCQFEEQWIVSVAGADAGPDVTYCGETSPIAIGTNGNPNFTYSWSVISGDPISSLSNPNIPKPLASPSTTTTYELTLMVPEGSCSVKDTVTVINFPVDADAGVDATLCMGEDVVLGGEPTEAGYSYGWAPGVYIDSQTTAQPTFKGSLCFDEDIYPETNNPMELTLTKIHDDSGCKNTDTVLVYLLHTDMRDRCGAPTTIGIQKDSCGLDLPGVNFNWSVISGDAASITGQENDRYPFVNPASITTYNLDVELNGKTCSSETTVDFVCFCSVDAIATSDIVCPIGGAYNTRLSGAVAMPGSSGGTLPSGYRFEWSPAFGLVSPNSLETEVMAIPQDTTYTLSIIDESDGSVLCSDNVRVYSSLATEPYQGLDLPDYVCAGAPTEIGVPGVAGWDYVWSPSTGLSNANISNPIATVTENTLYDLVATDAVTGCVIPIEVEIIAVNPIVDAGPDEEFCENAVVELGTPAIPGQTYSWQPAIGLTAPTAAQPLDTLFTNIQFELTVTDVLTGCTAVDLVDYTLTSPPVVDAGSDVTVCSGGSGTLIGPAPLVGYTYQWSPIDDLSDPEIAQPLANPTATTTYTLLAADGNPGCYASDEVIVTVGPAYSLVLDDIEICVGDAASIGIADAGGTYSWTPATDLTDANASQTSASPTVTTTYTLTWVTPDGCSISDEVVVTVLPVPVANTSNLTVCAGESIVIGDVAASGTVTYVWTSISGDAVSSLSATDVAQPIATPSQTSVYQVMASRPSGCSVQADVTVTVEAVPALDLGTDFTICGPTTLDATTTGATSYAWNTLEDTAMLPISTTTETTYSVTVTNAAGCTATDEITVLPTYEVNAGFDRGICPGTSVAIGMSDLGAGYTYSWTPTDGLSSSTISNPTATPTANTTYVLTVDNGSGCSITDDITITLKVAPTLATISPQTICSGTCASIDIPAEAGVNYYWSPTTGLNTATGSSVIACPTTNTTYTITAVSAEGCISTTTTSVNVVMDPPPTVVAGTDQEVCSGETVQLGATGTAGVTYYWSSPDTEGVTALDNAFISNPMASLINGGNSPIVRTFIVEAVDDNTFCSSLDTVSITVGNYPAITVNSIPTLCSGGTITLGSSNISYVGNDNSYLWSPAANVSDPTAAYPTVTGTETTVLSVTVTNTVTGCASVNTIDLNISTEDISANAGEDQDLCVDELVMIGSPAEAGVTYEWTSRSLTGSSFSTSSSYYINGSTRNDAQPYPRVSSSSYKRVYRLQATGAGGCVSIDEVTVLVNNQISTVNAGVNQFVCGDSSTILSGSDPDRGDGIWTQVTGPNTAVFADNTLENTAVSGLVTGTYEFKWAITGDVCNPGEDLVNIEVVDAPNLVTNAVAACGTADLTAAAVTTGSTNLGNLSYWIDANTTIQLDNPDNVTTAGTYYIRSISAEGCEAIEPVSVTISGTPSLAATFSNPSACGVMDGSISLTLTNVPDGTYTIDYMDATPSAQTFTNVSVTAGSATITGLGAGVFNDLSITISACASVEDVDITLAEPTTGTAMTSSTAETCAFSDGSIQVTITGGSAPFDFNWDNSNGTSGSSMNETSPYSISNLGSGTYSITVVDNIGCSIITSETVTAPSGCCASLTNPTLAQNICDDQNVSSLEVTTDGSSSIDFVYFTTVQTAGNMYSGGTSLGITTPSSGTASLSNVSFPTSGVYYVYAILSPTPTSGACRPFQQIQVTVGATPDITYTLADITICEGADAVFALSNSETGFNYQLRNDVDDSAVDAPLAGTGSSIDFTVSGLTTIGTYTYNVLATHASSGCNAELTDKAVVEVEGVPTLAATSSNPTICGATDGSISLILTNVPDGTYTIDYMDATPSAQTFTNVSVTAGSATITGLGAGVYNDLTITTGCTSADNVDITLTEICNYDWGDLPDTGIGTGAGNYETSSASNGPSHLIVSGLLLGTLIDNESDGQQDALAEGDDNADGNDDEEGVRLPSPIIPGNTEDMFVTSTNTTGSTAYLEAWIDWNNDGDFDDAGEMVINDDDSSGSFAGTYAITAPNDTPPNVTVGVRVRLSNQDNMTPYGAIGSGEVEDYLLSIGGSDYGNDFSGCTSPTCHNVSADIYLGAGVSTETTASSTDDADGMDLGPNFNIRPGITVSFPVTIYNNTGNTAYLAGWADWNGDGDYDDLGEQFVNTSYDAATYNGSFVAPVPANVPSDVNITAPMNLRFRLSTDNTILTSPCGTASCANDGEVEDYLIQIECKTGVCVPVQLTIRRENP